MLVYTWNNFLASALSSFIVDRSHGVLQTQNFAQKPLSMEWKPHLYKICTKKLHRSCGFYTRLYGMYCYAVGSCSHHDVISWCDIILNHTWSRISSKQKSLSEISVRRLNDIVSEHYLTWFCQAVHPYFWTYDCFNSSPAMVEGGTSQMTPNAILFFFFFGIVLDNFLKQKQWNDHQCGYKHQWFRGWGTSETFKTFMHKCVVGAPLHAHIYCEWYHPWYGETYFTEVNKFGNLIEISVLWLNIDTTLCTCSTTTISSGQTRGRERERERERRERNFAHLSSRASIWPMHGIWRNEFGLTFFIVCFSFLFFFFSTATEEEIRSAHLGHRGAHCGCPAYYLDRHSLPAPQERNEDALEVEAEQEELHDVFPVQRRWDRQN